MQRVDGLEPLRGGQRAVGGHREYNPGWHAALDLHNLLTVSEAIARCALERGEPRRSLPRRLSDKDPAFATFNLIVRKGRDGDGTVPRRSRMPEELKAIIEANMTTATFQIWRGGQGGGLKDFTTTVTEGMVVLGAVHQIQAEQANDLAVAGTARRASDPARPR